MRLEIIIIDMISLILYNEMLNVYFPNDLCVVFQNHAWVKDLIKLKEISMNFNIIAYKKFIDCK